MTPENKRRLACILGVAAGILAARATLEYARIHASDIDESDDSSSVSRYLFCYLPSLHDVNLTRSVSGRRGLGCGRAS
jgi:hypothetical protein